MIYAIGQSVYGPLKIGITGDIKSRIKIMQTSSPKPLNAYLAASAWFDVGGLYKDDEHFDDSLAEKLLHDKYRDKRLSGEWFDLSVKTILQDDPYIGGREIKDKKVVKKALEHLGMKSTVIGHTQQDLVFFIHWQSIKDWNKQNGIQPSINQ